MGAIYCGGSKRMIAFNAFVLGVQVGLLIFVIIDSCLNSKKGK